MKKFDPYFPVVYTPTYNDAEALATSLDMMKDLKMKRLVVDGRYHGFPQINDSDISTDDTQEVCKQYDVDYRIVSPCYEEQKFTFAANTLHIEGHKIMMLCSSDERFTIVKEYLLPWLKHMCLDAEYPMSFHVLIDEKHPGHKYEQGAKMLPKIFYNLGKIEAKHVHWAIYVKGTNQLLKAYPNPSVGIMLHHDYTWRSKERDGLMTAFQDTNVKREKRLLFKIGRDRAFA